MTSRRDVKREILIHRYIQALDNADADAVAAVLDAAALDVELDRAIDGVNSAILAEESLVQKQAS